LSAAEGSHPVQILFRSQRCAAETGSKNELYYFPLQKEIIA
jgi:hypothetical protein